MAAFLTSLSQGKIPVEKREDMPKNILNPLLKKRKENIGFTMSNIVWLGNQLESTNYTESALKNWVKREIKGYIGAPQVGRKYSVQQVAMLFIVKDLKVLLDFETIRKVLSSVFNNPVDREDDIISPIKYYESYAILYEKLIHNGLLSEEQIKKEIVVFLEKEDGYSDVEKNKIFRALIVAILAVRTNYLKAWAKRYVTDQNGKE